MKPPEEVLTGTIGSSQRARHRMLTAVAAALVISVALNVLLAEKVRRLNHFRAGSIADHLLKAGSTVPPIAAKRLDGQQERISYHGASQRTFLYIFPPP